MPVKESTNPSVIDPDTRTIRVAIFILSLVLFIAATILVILNRNALAVSTVYSAAALCLVFTFLPMFKSFKGFGMEANLKEQMKGIEDEQQSQKKDIDLIQKIAFAGIVSKYEEEHLKGLAEEGKRYPVRYSQDLKDELNRLDDFGFILPNEGKGLNTLDKEFGADINKYKKEDKTEFDLKGYVHITEYGENYIQLAKNLGLPKRK